VAHIHTLTLVPAKDATCTAPGNTAYYVCDGNDGCRKWFSDEVGTQEITDHASVEIAMVDHSYDDTTWGYKDAEGHAHKCHNCDAHDGIQSHTPGDPATTTTPQTCTECGYEMAPVIGHTHSFGKKWESDETDHWHQCDCGEKSEVAPHSEDDGTVTKQPTKTESGIK